MQTDECFMRMAFDLALLGAGKVNPNPMVGAVIVKNGDIVATGWHKQVGLDHAELDAIKNAAISLEGTTLYCNLEPCCHTNKRTPPCAQRIIKEGIKKVVISNLDPNPEVAGKGVELLKQNGVEVTIGVLEQEGFQLNEIFFTHITQKRPFIQIKMAQTLDGRLATVLNDSKWITGEKARLHVHQQRLKFDAILIGLNTLRKDNPCLTVRIPGQETIAKYRIVLSHSNDIDKSYHLFSDQYKNKTILVLPLGSQASFNCTTIECPLIDGKNFDLSYLHLKLYQDFGICALYVEGGSYVHTSYLEQQKFDRVSIYIAPIILGTGLNSIGQLDNQYIKDAHRFKNVQWQPLENDLFFTATRI